MEISPTIKASDVEKHLTKCPSQAWKTENNNTSAIIFSLNSNLRLAKRIVANLGSELGEIECSTFADGETKLRFISSLRGKNVYVIQSTSPPVNEHLMELLFAVSTCRRASAASITAVIPYFGYARQDRRLTSRVPISAADVARLLESVGVSRVISVDLHCGQLQGFFGPTVPVDNLEARPIGIDYFAGLNLKNVCIVSPDAGGVYRARQFQEGLVSKGMETSLAMIIKERRRPNEIENMTLVGCVKDCDVIVVDDMIDTAGTLCEAGRSLMAHGARSVRAMATHGVFSGPALTRINDSVYKEVVVTDSIWRPEIGECPKITRLSISILLADAICRVNNRKSFSGLQHKHNQESKLDKENIST